MMGKLLTRLFALFGITFTCVACYGIMEADYNPQWRAQGRVVDEEGDPIKDIEVSIGHSKTTTDEHGAFYIRGGSSQLLFTDVDGAENGEFEMRSITLESSESDVGDVVLTAKGSDENQE